MSDFSDSYRKRVDNNVFMLFDFYVITYMIRSCRHHH